MALMRPRSALSALGEDVAAFEEVLKSPSQCLRLPTCEDASKLTNDGFQRSTHETSYYMLLKELTKPGRLRIAKRASCLALDYSSYASISERHREARVAGEWLGKASTLTALQLAYGESQPSLRTLRTLVGQLNIKRQRDARSLTSMATTTTAPP